MKYNPLAFVEFTGAVPQIGKVQSALKNLKPFYLKWLRRVDVSEKTITLCFNFSVPSEMWIKRDFPALLEAEGIGLPFTFERLRPAVLHPSAKDKLPEIKKKLGENPKDLSWLDENLIPFASYLSQYQFLHLESDHECLGYDPALKQVLFKSWLVSLEMTEKAGEDFLLTWSNLK